MKRLKYGVGFEQHDDRYARTGRVAERGRFALEKDHVDFAGKYYRIQDGILQPKPITHPRPTIYAGGESEAAKNLIAKTCDAYVMHGDPPNESPRKLPI